MYLFHLFEAQDHSKKLPGGHRVKTDRRSSRIVLLLLLLSLLLWLWTIGTDMDLGRALSVHKGSCVSAIEHSSIRLLDYYIILLDYSLLFS